MAEAVGPVDMGASGENSAANKAVVKEQEIHHALTPPASDESRNGDGSRKDHLSDDDSDLSEIDNVDELADYGRDIEMPDISASTSAAKIRTPETDGAEERMAPAEDDIYANVQPDRIEGGVPVFCPTMEQFKDFEKYMKAVNPYGMKSGITLIDPPEEWKRDRKPLDERVKTIKVKNPISQAFNGTGGFWTQENMEKQRSYNLPQWKTLCDQSEHQPPAQRGTARGGTASRIASRNNPKARLDDSVEGQKRKAGRPRVNALKEEEAADDQKSDTTASSVTPPTPTSPGDQAHIKEEGEEENPEEPSPTKPRGRPGRKPGPKTKGRPGRKPGAKPGPKPGPKLAGASGNPKKTSVASRRMHNQHIVNDEVDEEAFNDFDYHLAEVDTFDDERCAQLEQQYWKGLTFSPPMYGADMPGSLFDDDTNVWNVAKLPNVLDLLDKAVPGVNTAYLYLGMWKATFAWHLEDVDLYSINYIHFGAPKQWYSISQADAPRFEKAMRSLWPNDSKYCSQFLRHKTYLISPLKLLNDFGIKVNKVVHREGQFMITYPYGYHSGFNYGYNCAESVNFALEEWLTYAQTSQKCNCAEDSVFIDVHDILRKLHPEDYVDEYQEVTDDEDDEAPADLPTPPSSVKGRPGRKRKRQDDKAGKPAKKTKRIKINRGYQPCVLCPNNQEFDDLIMTDDGKLAHRKCATYTVETFIVEENGRDIVKGISNIHKDKWALQCNYCRQKKGVCFQCHTPKCTRAYHATCAVMAGVQVDEADTPRFYEGVEYRDPIIDLRCKTHRTVKLARPSTDSAATLQLARTFSESYFEYASSLKVNDLVQFQVSHLDSITAAVVVRPYDGSGYLRVRSLSQNQAGPNEHMSVDISWLMFVDASNSTIPRCSANAKDMPKWVADKLLSSPEKLEAAERLPAVGDPFIEGTEQTDKAAFFLKWDGFQNRSEFFNADQKKVDILKENVLWHYMGSESSTSKDKYCSDLSRKVHDDRSDFLASVPQPPRPIIAPPAKRVSLPSTHTGFRPVQTQQSQAQQNMARRLEELKNNRQILLQNQLQGKVQVAQQGKQENGQPSLLQQAGHGTVQSPYHHGATPHSPSPLRTESSMNKATGPNVQTYKIVNSPYQAYARPQSSPATQATSSFPSYQYSGTNRQITPNPPKSDASSQDTKYEQPPGSMARNLPANYQRNLQYSLFARNYQSPFADQKVNGGARHQYTDAWKDNQEYWRTPQQPTALNQRMTLGMSPHSDAQSKSHVPSAPANNSQSPAPSGDTSRRTYLQDTMSDQRHLQHNEIPRPSLTTSLSIFPNTAVHQSNGQGVPPGSATNGTTNIPAAQRIINNAGSVKLAHTPQSHPYQSPYARAGGSNPMISQVLNSIANSAKSQSSSIVSSSNIPANGVQPSNDVGAQVSSPPTQSRESAHQNKPTSSPSPSALSLQDIEARVRTPGGLRLIAGTIQMPSGTLADDLQIDTDGTRRRSRGSRRMNIQEWIEGIDDEEETLLKAKLKKMGII